MKIDLVIISVLVGILLVALVGQSVGQDSQMNLFFTENGKSLKVYDLKVEILTPSTNDVLFSLPIVNDAISITSQLRKEPTFDVRLTFNQYQLVLPKLDPKYFDNEWVVDIRNRLPQKKSCSQGKKQVTCGLRRVFRVDFNPSIGMGFWWLITGSETQHISKPDGTQKGRKK